MNALVKLHHLKYFQRLLFSATLIALITGCSGGGGSEFAGLEANKGAANIPCKLDTKNPSTATMKVAAAAGSKTLFTVNPSTSTCKVFYFINGVKFNTASSITAEIDSSLLSSGSNTIRVEATNDLGTDSYDWTVSKNTPPSCTRASPVGSTLNLSTTSSQAFTVNATTEAGETLSFQWKLDGATNAALVETISGTTASQAMLTSSAGLVGLRSIDAVISDGLDTTTCSWQANIGQECSLTGKSPALASVRLAAAAGSSNGFSVTANTASCLASWTLNGVDISGTGLNQTISSGQLNTGSNILKAEVTSSSGVTNQTWTVIKNSPPTCSQTPAATGNSLSVGNTINLTANLSDANSDSITYGWKQNGSTTSSPPVAISGGASTTTAAFTPTSSHIGYNSFDLRLDDGYDSATCSWTVQVLPSCSLTSFSPNSATATIPNLGTTLNAFNISPSDGSCTVSWTLNGINLGTNSSIVNLLSSSFGTSNNLTATVANATSTQSHTWTVTKNTPPVCASQTPANTGTNLAVSASQNFVANITDVDVGQTLSYAWKLDGGTPSATYFSNSNGASSSTGSWTALNAQVGSHNLSVDVGDGYDTVACNWPVDVMRNCAVSSATPSATSLRVSFAPSTSTSFGVVANDPSCAITWKLNGSTVSTDVNFQNFLSSGFSAGSSDSVTATLSNAVGATTRTWTVSKNSKPVCASQTPAATGNSINVGGSQVFTANATDVESDTLAFSWTFNGANAGLFSSVSNSTFASNATLSPGLGQVGTAHTVALTMNDGYDSSTCTWNVDVIDPNSAQIVSSTPSVDPVVILSNGSQTFTVSATGTGLVYVWYLDNVVQSGKTTSAETFANTDMTVGNHTIKIIVTDTYSNTAQKIFNVKRNAAPSKSAYSPNLSDVPTYKVGLNSSLNFSVTASDANSDTLTYTWTIDNSTSAALTTPVNPYAAALNPGGNTLLLGPHSVKVAISDGYETTTQTWSVMVNMFSAECNDLYNSSPTGTNGGRVCTLIGNPSMGHTQDISTDPTLLKAKPYKIIELEANVYAFTDHVNHTVMVYNANTGGANKSYFGRTIAPKTAEIVLGNGAQGRNSDASSSVPAYQTVGTSPTVNMPNFKLNEPRGLAYDSVKNVLYVADRLNRRVVALNSSGNVYRVLGLTAAGSTQDATTNSLTESFGYNQVCLEPIGLAISGRYLYVGCWAQHVIKRVNIDDPANAATYSLAKTVVGRQNASSANVTSPIGSVSPDGLADGSPTAATGGVVYANNVISVAADNAGLVYWLERSGGSQGYRLRALNTTGSSVNFYTSTPNSDHVSLSGAFAFQAFDLTGNTLTSTSLAANIVNATTGVLSAVGVQAHTVLGQNICHAVNVRLLNGTTSIVLGTSSTVTMAMTAGTGGFYSDSACSSSLASNQFTIPAGASQGSVFMKLTATGAFTAQATTGGFSSTTSGTVSTTSTVPTAVRVSGPPRFKPNECVMTEFTLVNATPVLASAPAGRVIAPTMNNYGSYYSDSGCTTRVDRISFAAGDFTKFVYFKRTVDIPAGWVGSLTGYNNSAAAAYGEYAYGVKLGQMRFEDGQADLSIKTNSGTGLPDGIFYSNQSQHYVAYLNFKTVDPGMAVAIPSQSAEIVVGQGNAVTPTDINGGYNGEDQPAWGTRVNQPTGVTINLAQSKVLIGDYVNNRGRTYEIDINGYLRTSLGAGRTRDRAGVTVADPTQVALVNPYKLEFFNGSLYFSEYGNSRIRKTNLSSGTTDVIAGNGSSGTPTEGNDAIADVMTNPRGFKVIAYPNATSPTNYVLFYAETCQIRAVNISGPTISNFFGVGNLLPGKVKTIAGDTTFGCSTWSSLPNSDGMTATNARLNTPEDVAYIDGEIYVINAADHCLLRIATDGKIYRPQGVGSCSATVPSTNDATMDLMRTRYPKSFAPDVGHPGNYFLIDQYSDGTGFIRYLNTLTSAFTFKNTAPINIAARASAVAAIPVKQVYQYVATSGASGVGGVASWVQTTGSAGANDKVCWTAGILNDGSNGAHAVYCANRNQDDDGTLAAGPSSASSVRGGAPLDREQEKIGRLNATFYAPYGIAFDDDGNLYISEFNNHIIRMVRRWW